MMYCQTSVQHEWASTSIKYIFPRKGPVKSKCGDSMVCLAIATGEVVLMPVMDGTLDTLCSFVPFSQLLCPFEATRCKAFHTTDSEMSIM